MEEGPASVEENGIDAPFVDGAMMEVDEGFGHSHGEHGKHVNTLSHDAALLCPA